ncbi:MAG: YceH family protein [Acidobacteria bacterium]|nr:YceH family protein [Acidobacteriota bacterium]
MPLTINETEARVLGSLVEKQLTTPEYYPLTLNALTAACNQKSNRDPVMSLGETEILAAIDSLRDKNLVYLYYGSSSRTVKYKHMLPNVFEIEAPAVAILTLLLLRGPQTAGEMRGRADRLYEFSGIGEVQETLDELARRDDALVVKLERQPGQKESRYAHLLSGPVDAAAVTASAESTYAASPTASGGRIEQLEQQVEKLSSEMAELRSMFEEFRKQFE